MAKPRRSRPYSERSDIEKIRSNWRKIEGLISRGEWSGAIVRAATATEIAANLAIRQELIVARNLDGAFVDHLLVWANGLQGKFERLILPITRSKDFKKLKSNAGNINSARNEIVHRGAFKKEETARRIVEEARVVISGLVTPYHATFELSDDGACSGTSQVGIFSTAED